MGKNSAKERANPQAKEKARKRKERKPEDFRSEFEKKGKPIYFEMSDGSQVRVLDFNLAQNPKNTIFFVPGFITVFQSFEEALIELAKDYRIFYFESREKHSSKLVNNKPITVYRSVLDLKEVIEQLKLDGTDYFTVSSSYGGTLMIEVLARQWISPKFAVLVGPSVEIDIKWVVVPFARFFGRLRGPLVRWIVKTWLNIFYVEKHRDIEQQKKYMRSVFENDNKKYLAPMKEMRKYKGWDLCPKITTKCLIVGETKDKMHIYCKKTAELIPDAILVDLETNKATHGKPLVEVIDQFIDELKNASLVG